MGGWHNEAAARVRDDAFILVFVFLSRLEHTVIGMCYTYDEGKTRRRTFNIYTFII